MAKDVYNGSFPPALLCSAESETNVKACQPAAMTLFVSNYVQWCTTAQIGLTSCTYT